MVSQNLYRYFELRHANQEDLSHLLLIQERINLLIFRWLFTAYTEILSSTLWVLEEKWVCG